MGKIPKNIHPIFDTFLNRDGKEKLLKQRAKVIWLTGLSGSGKSSIAKGLERELYERGFLTTILDGDKVRGGINNNLLFSDQDRKENIRRVAEVAKLFLDTGVITICSFVSPTNEIRNQAKTIIGKDDFIEVFVNTTIEECEQRDVKGLYAKARNGDITDFTGISSPYEIPRTPAIEVKTKDKSPEQSVEEVLSLVLPQILDSFERQDKI
jgi:adenylylsulfate kinase